VAFAYLVCYSSTSNTGLIEHLIYRTGGGKLEMLSFAQLVELTLTSHCWKTRSTLCPKSGAGGITNCFGNFLGLHLTLSSTTSLEVGSHFICPHTSGLTLCRALGSGSPTTNVKNSNNIIIIGASLCSFFIVRISIFFLFQHLLTSYHVF